MPPTPHAPLLILGSHRSGTSAVAGLLHTAAGLYMGDLMPASPDNPKGYFESASVMKAHDHMLSDMGRDWTCPPRHLEPDAGEHPAFIQAIGPLLNHDGQWGVKDPRLLFMLGAWLNQLDSLRLIGVIRNPGSIARSISKRDAIPDRAAHELVAAHVERLADLHRAAPFPIVDFGAEPEIVLSRVARIAELLELPWDDGEARRFFAPSLIHHRAELSPDPNYNYLRAAAKEPIADWPVVAATNLAETLRELGDSAAPEPGTTYGPRFIERRRRLWRHILNDEGVESVLEILPQDAAHVPLDPGRFEYRAQVILQSASSLPRQLRTSIPPSHVIGPGVMEAVRAEDLATFLTDLDLGTRTLAVAWFDGYFVDGAGDDNDTSGAPTRHSRLAIEQAVAATSWRIEHLETSSTQRGLLTISKTSDAFRSRSPGTDAERMLLNLDARISVLERAAAQQREVAADHRSEASKERVAELQRDNERLQHELADAEWRYQRLAGRRSVRMSLRLASFTRPLFRWWRGRKRTGGA